ncbi:MAG: dipeptidase [Cellulomonadaceae bacterium]
MPDSLRRAVADLMPRALDDLAELVAIPSVADPRQFPPAECERAAAWVRDAFSDLGVPCELVRTPDGTDAVIGHRPGPDGAPTVLLYAHYDVQPPLDEAAWVTPPFALIERDGRYVGRGAADCKGNVIAHLTALRALRETGQDLGVGLRVVVEGSEEQGTGGLEHYLLEHPDELPADVVLVVDTGNVALGVPTLTTSLRGSADVVVRVETLQGEVHSGAFGGAAPDALAALVRLLASLQDDAGDVTIDGLEAAQVWDGADYDAAQFRSDAGVLEGVRLIGSGRVTDALWARPAVTVTGIDAPAVVGSANAVQPRAAARINLRVPPGTDAREAQRLLIAHLERHAPWGARVSVEAETPGQPFRARTDGQAFAVLSGALADAFGAERTVTSGSGGSIPLCGVFETVNPGAEIVLMGVEEPACQIHAPNESVAPSEIAGVALGEALFLARLGEASNR